MRSGATPLQVAMLIGGLACNAAFLELCAPHYRLIGDPVRLVLKLLFYAVVLAVGLFWLPRRMLQRNGRRGLAEVIELCMGPQASWFFSNLLIPVWALLWFGYCFHWIFRLLFPVLNEKGGAGPFAAYCLTSLLVFFVVAPLAGRTIVDLARLSGLLTKFSVAAIVGLLLSSLSRFSSSLDSIWVSINSPWLPLEAEILLWFAPPLLLLAELPLDNLNKGHTRWLFLAIFAAVTLPVLIVLVTTAGATQMSGMLHRNPSFMGYAAARFERLGWLKLLVLSLTLLTACRFAAIKFNGAAAEWIHFGKWTSPFVTLLVVLLSLVGYVYQPFRPPWPWQLAALPFVTLAGVLCGFAVAKPDPAQINSRWGRYLAFAAWLIGSVVACMPVELEHNLTLPAWVIAGWAVSFAISWTTATLRASFAGIVPPSQDHPIQLP